METLSSKKIKEIIKYNEYMQKAYNKFKTEHPCAKVLDIYSMAHFVKPIEEIVIKYSEFGYTKRFYYEERI